MTFGEKLVKMRQEHEYSQEQLAGSLDVTTLAIMKWEDGRAHPDTKSKLRICQLFKCDMDYLEDDTEESQVEETVQEDIVVEELEQEDFNEIVEDEVKVNNSKGKSPKKLRININIKGILSFVNQSYDMIYNMESKQRIRLICEMVAATVVLLILGIVLHKAIYGIMDSLLGASTIGERIVNIISTITGFVIQVMGLVCLIQFFKIRYCVQFKKEEQTGGTEINIPNINLKFCNFKFADLSIAKKIVFIAVKTLAVVCVIPLIVFFIGLVCFIVMSAYHVQYSLLFLWLAVLFVGINCLAYAIIELGYRFIFSIRQEFRKTFSTAVIGILIIGIGTGLSISTYINYEMTTEFDDEVFVSTIVEITMDDKVVLDRDVLPNMIEVADDKIKNHIIKIEMKSLKNVSCELLYETQMKYRDYYIKQEVRPFIDTYQLVLQDLKNEKRRDYKTVEYTEHTKVIITTSYANVRELRNIQKEFTEKVDRNLSDDGILQFF